MFTAKLILNKEKIQHYGNKHPTRRFSSLDVYWQSVCTNFRSNLVTWSLIGLCIKDEALWRALGNWMMSYGYGKSQYRCAFQFHFVFYRSIIINKYKCMVLNQQVNVRITYMNTTTLTMCDFWENTTRKHDQRCSVCRGLYNNMKYIVCIIYSIHIRNNIITRC